MSFLFATPAYWYLRVPADEMYGYGFMAFVASTMRGKAKRITVDNPHYDNTRYLHIEW